MASWRCRLSSFVLFALAVGACGRLAEEPVGVAAPIDSGTSVEGGTQTTPGLVDASVADAALESAAPPSADGVCINTDVQAGIVDPDCVYLLGTLNEGDSFRNVLIDPAQPADRAFGFGHTRRTPLVHPLKGRTWFMGMTSTPPVAVYSFTKSVPVNELDITNQLAAQTIIPTPSCPSNLLDKFFIAPDDGALVYTCGNVFVEGTAAPIDLKGHLPFALGADRLFLASSAGEFALVKNGVVTPLPSTLWGLGLYVARSRPGGGFFVVAGALGTQGQLVEILPDGTTKVLGSYDFGPPQGGIGPGPNCVLDRANGLVCLNRIPGAPTVFADGVVRFSLNAPPVLVFDERNSDVKIHLSSLVTGP